MITKTLRHLAWCGVLSVGMVFPAIAQTNQQTTSDQKANQQTKSRQKSTDQLTSQEKDFLNKAAMDNMTEIQMGKLAQQKSQNPQVQQYGQTLVSDHQNAQDKLKTIAQQYNVTLPSSLDEQHQGEANRLSKLSGTEFDKAFLQNQVTDHQNAIKEFKNISENAQDQAVKQYASNTVPVLQKHLNRAQDLKQNMTRTSKNTPQKNTSQGTERSKPGTQNPSYQH